MSEPAEGMAAGADSGIGDDSQFAPAAEMPVNFGSGPGPADAITSPPFRRRGFGARLARLAGWTALLLVVATCGLAMVHYRQTISIYWPQSASLYSAMGMPVNTRGVALTNVAYQQQFEDGQPVLSVTGKVVNVSNREQLVPEIRVVLMDDANRELYHWTFDVGVVSLQPGAESPFMTRLSSPPPEARNLNIRFAEAGEQE
jgi:hypothetical protein